MLEKHHLFYKLCSGSKSARKMAMAPGRPVSVATGGRWRTWRKVYTGQFVHWFSNWKHGVNQFHKPPTSSFFGFSAISSLLMSAFHYLLAFPDCFINNYCFKHIFTLSTTPSAKKLIAMVSATVIECLPLYHSFFFSIQRICIEHLPCAKHCSRYQRHSSGHSNQQNLCLCGAHILAGVNRQSIN